MAIMVAFYRNVGILCPMITLDITKRDINSKLETLRRDGFIPAVFYGRKEESTPISVNEINFLKVLKEAGESSVISLVDGSEKHDALIHDVAKDSVSGKVIHVDFYIIEKGKKVEVNIPIVFTGVSFAQKELGGSLVKVMHEIEVSAEASNLPHEIEVDISALTDFESRILVKDIKLPAGVTFVSDEEEVIALVTPAKEEVEEEVAPMDISEIGLSEEKGKKEEEGAEA
jgi:large subunit ribosomal protein L25